MENFTIEGRYLKLCKELRAVTRCLKAAFYRPDYQKLLMCPLIKRLGQTFVSKHAAKSLKCLAECLGSLVACLCYNTAHTVPFSHSSFG